MALPTPRGLFTSLTDRFGWRARQTAASAFEAWAGYPKRRPIFEAVGKTVMALVVGTLFFGTLGLAWWLRSLAKADVIPVWVFQVTSVGALVIVSGTITPIIEATKDVLCTFLAPARFQAAQLAVDTDCPCDPLFKKRCMNLQARGVLADHFNQLEWRVAHWLWNEAAQRRAGEAYLSAVLPPAEETPAPRARL